MKLIDIPLRRGGSGSKGQSKYGELIRCAMDNVGKAVETDFLYNHTAVSGVRNAATKIFAIKPKDFHASNVDDKLVIWVTKSGAKR